MFMLRNTQRAAKRGYAVAASAASLEVEYQRRRRQRITPSFGASRMSPIARWMASFDAMGRDFRCRDYGGDDRMPISATMLLEGELAPPATMIGHEAAAIEEPEPAVVRRSSLFHRCRLRNPPPSVTSVSGSPHGFARA